MKQAFILCMIAMAMASCESCTKEPVQSQCGQVYDIKETWSDSGNKASQLLSVDTVWKSSSVVCGEQYQRYKNYKEHWVRMCDADGVTKYWEHYFITTK
ncbi:MAG: hypothetical protein ACJ749_17930 [Flavisolibacter sp.]|jgi:carboxypeptidase C (cathepsin A)